MYQASSSDVACLREISSIVSDTDVSSFEIIHSGLITKLSSYLTSSAPTHDQSSSSRNDRLRLFLHVFAGCPVNSLVTAVLSQQYCVLVTLIIVIIIKALIVVMLSRHGSCRGTYISTVMSDCQQAAVNDAVRKKYIQCLLTSKVFDVRQSQLEAGFPRLLESPGFFS